MTGVVATLEAVANLATFDAISSGVSFMDNVTGQVPQLTDVEGCS